MKLQFLGAAGTVTGSKYSLSVNDETYLVDCGLFQGLKNLRLHNWEPLPIASHRVAAVLMTHAHLDHSGYLPLLAKQGFAGPVYATHGTRALCGILLPDSGHLQEEEAEYANRHGFSKHHPALPLYTKEDAVHCLELFKPVAWHEKIRLGAGASARFFRAGHILGSALIRFEYEGRSLTFSGDLGRPHSPILMPPENPPETDYLVVESTYGDRTHPAEDPKAALKSIIEKTVYRGGIVLIPAFAVGRTQDLLHVLSELKRDGQIPDVPVYLNSPMAIESTRIYRDHLEDLLMTPEECARHCAVARYVSTVEDSKSLVQGKEPAIIISASGMATGGRILHHLKALAPDARNTIVLTGFQAAGTRGESLARGADEIKIHGMMVPVRAEIRQMDALSAHADAGEIMAWLGRFPKPPKTTFITHGEPTASEALRKRVQEELGWNAVVPEMGQTFGLN